MTLDTSGNVVGRQSHLPFGEDFAETGTQAKHHFTSYERDGESASDYGVNRQYSQGVGRFNRTDPYEESNDIGLPQTLNRYAYVTGDPINAVDPLGLSVEEVCFWARGPSRGEANYRPYQLVCILRVTPDPRSWRPSGSD